VQYNTFIKQRQKFYNENIFLYNEHFRTTTFNIN